MNASAQFFGYFAVLNSDNALGGAGNRVVVGDKNYGSSLLVQLL